MEELLSMNGIVKSFPGVQALKGVHFDLRAGEVRSEERRVGKEC